MDTSTSTDATQLDEGSTESQEQMFGRHRQELSRLVDQLLREQQLIEVQTRSALDANASTQLATVIDELRRNLQAERARDQLFAVPIYGSPSEAKALEEIAQKAAPGERAVLVIIPRPTAHDGPIRKAWCFLDVSSAVWRT